MSLHKPCALPVATLASSEADRELYVALHQIGQRMFFYHGGGGGGGLNPLSKIIAPC